MDPGPRDPHKRARRAREAKSKVESCITFSAFRKIVRRTCRILSRGCRGFAATKGFVLNLRSLVAAEAARCCQRAVMFQRRLSSRNTLDETAVQVADEENRQATDPAVHNLCEAVAGDSAETRQLAMDRFFALDWWPAGASDNRPNGDIRRDSNPVEYNLVHYRAPKEPKEPEGEGLIALDYDPFET